MAEMKSKLQDFYKRLDSRKSTYFLAYSVIFAILAIGVFSFYFFTRKTFIWEVDGWEQHYKSLIYYSQYLRDFFKNIFINHQFVIPQWDFAIGEGSDVIGTFHYYVIGDPFTFFCFLFPAKYMYIFYEAMILLRIYLSGIAFSLLCFYIGHKKRYVLPGTVTYAFCYWAIYNAVRHPFFLNPLLYYPLLVLGVEKIIREKKMWLFTITVAIAAMSNFYFFYMLVFTTIIYVIVRFIFCYGKNVKMWGKGILRLAVSSVTGLCMAAIVFLPVLHVFLSDSRFNTPNKMGLVYPFSYYAKLPGLFIVEGDNFWTCMGFAVPVLLAVLLMFKSRRKYTMLKTYFIISAVMICIPFFGQAMNGFSYMCNRWIYSFALLCAYILVCMMPRLITLERKEIRFIGVALTIYFVVCMCVKYSRNGKLISAVAIGAILLIGLSIKNVNEYNRCMMVTVAVMLAALANGIWKNASFGENYAAQCISVKMAQEDVFGSEKELISKDAEDTDFIRYSGSGLSYNMNCITGISSSNLYWTLTNPYVSKFRYDCAIRLDTLLPHKYTGYDDRSSLIALSSASKYLVSKTGGLVPYGFTYESENDDYVMYNNDNALPLGFTYDKAVNKREWEGLSAVDKQKAMLQAVVIGRSGKDTREALPDRVSVKDLSYDSQIKDYTMDYDAKEVQCTDNTFAVTKAGATVTFKFTGSGAGETYFNINGLDYEGAAQFQLYFGKRKFDPLDLYSKADWKELSHNEKKKIFKNFIYWTQSTSSVKLGIATDTGVTKSMNYFTSDYSYYSNQHDFSVNMGYSEENVTSVTVTFQKIGVYSYDDIQIVCQPMDSYTDEINALKENVLTDVELGNNKVTGQITLDRNKYLCLTIPYSKGWKVYVDGERQKLYNANGQYMAVYLTSGTHNVTLKYSTPLLKEGALVSLAGVAIFAMQLVINKRKKRE